jgi:DHA1 family tetracycline resistance protein-like MFS transporter
MQKLAKHPLFVVFLTIFLDMLGFGILIPVIPQLFAEPLSSYYLLNEYGLTPAQGALLVGLLTASFPAAQFFATPILGQMSDKFGRRKVLLVSLFGTFLSYLIFALGLYARSIPILFASRILDGVTGGNISVAQAVIADVSTPESRGKNFGLVGAAFALGFILGPLIGGVLSSRETGWFAHVTTPFLFAAFLSFINVLSVKYQLPETNKHQNKNLKLTPQASLQNISKAFTLPSVAPLFVTVLLLQGGFTFFTTFAGVYLTQYFGFTGVNIGKFFAYVGFWIVVTQGFVLRKLPAKLGDHTVVKLPIFCTKRVKQQTKRYKK